jgi:CheY-like chemotaxis protein
MTDLNHSELPKLLVVDDEQEILVALEDLLEDRYQLLSSTSPLAALEIVQANPDLAVIISDQRMPEMPGNLFLARARAFTDADTILLTGYADLSAVIAAVNEGAISGYAAKPWEPEALRTMVAAAAERHQLRAALRFEQSAFVGLMEASADQISVLDRHHRLIRGNHDRVENAAEGDARDKDEAALASGSYSEEDLQSGGEAHDERWTRVRRIPFGADGNERHLLKIESDETDRRRAAQRLHQAEKLQALGTLAGGIAHDFNNLLAAILGNLELAERSLDKPDRLARFLSNARSAAGRGSAITRRLLSFSRQRDLAAETFHPDDAVRDLEELVATPTARSTPTRASSSSRWSTFASTRATRWPTAARSSSPAPACRPRRSCASAATASALPCATMARASPSTCATACSNPFSRPSRTARAPALACRWCGRWWRRPAAR